jgi:beta-xylosidase
MHVHLSPKLLARGAAMLALAAAALVGAPAEARKLNPFPTHYENPILHSDYSDPDVIRVGDRYYMTASSFHFVPGLPILESRDLVHWALIGHGLERLSFDEKYDLPGPLGFSEGSERARFNADMGTRYSAGVWAPSIRHHKGRFYIYFATPTEGVFMVSADKPQGPWTPPVTVIAEARLEDPCPFWDDDGNAYLVHGRVGAGPLVLHRMSADGTRVLDAGKTIVDDPKNLPVLEGPKLLKRNGWYYIFAPYGGVEKGPQAVMRSKDIWGPYESRTVLAQGSTNVQAPHQGGYVETPSGEKWFIHFNSTGAYGRIVHLQPVRWVKDWPIMGDPLIENGKSSLTTGQPVSRHAMPRVGGRHLPVYPQTSDGFNSPTLGVQWEWNHNPVDSAWSLTKRPGYLTLEALPANDLLLARNTLTQVLHGSAARFTTRLDAAGMADGQRAGLGILQVQPVWIGIMQVAGRRHVTFSYAGAQTRGPEFTGSSIVLRLNVADETASTEYSLDDGKTFTSLGARARLKFSWWKGARPALFTYANTPLDGPPGRAAFDFLAVEVLAPKAW